MNQFRLLLRRGEYIEAISCQYHVGPGWSNHTISLVIRETQGGYRIETLQPSDFSRDVATLFPVCARAEGEMRAALQQIITWTDD